VFFILYLISFSVSERINYHHSPSFVAAYKLLIVHPHNASDTDPAAAISLHLAADTDAVVVAVHYLPDIDHVVAADLVDSTCYRWCIHAMSWCHGHRGDHAVEDTFRAEDVPEDGHEVEDDHELDAVHDDAVEEVHDEELVTDSDVHSHRDTQPFYGLVPFEMATLEVIREHTLRDDVPSEAMTAADVDSTYVVLRDVVDAEVVPYSEPLDFQEIVVPLLVAVIRVHSEVVPVEVVPAVLVVPEGVVPVVREVVLEGDPEDDGVLQIEGRY